MISRCLGSMRGIALLSEINPGGLHVAVQFDPLFQAQSWLNLFVPEEADEIRRNGPHDFGPLIALIARRAADRGEALVLRDWSYLDFVNVPLDYVKSVEIPAGRYEFSLASALEVDCTFRQATTVRHPAAMWESWRKYKPESRLTLEEMLKGCRRFAEHAERIGFARYEDITRNPQSEMETLCRMLELTFDPGFQENWLHYQNITGDVGNLTSVKIKGIETRPIAPRLLKELLVYPDYTTTLRILGYAEDTIP